MLFLIRAAFWLMIIVLLLPTDDKQRSEVYGTAQAAVNDVTSFCDRNPETCARGKDAFAVFVQKAEFGARMLMDLIQNKAGGGTEQPAPAARDAELRRSRLRQADSLRHERFEGHAQSGRSRRGLVRARTGRHLNDSADLSPPARSYKFGSPPPAKGAQLGRFLPFPSQFARPNFGAEAGRSRHAFPPILSSWTH